MILTPIWFLCSVIINVITFIIVNIFISFKYLLSKYFRPFPIKEGTIRNKDLIELHPTTNFISSSNNSADEKKDSSSQIQVVSSSSSSNRIQISTVTEAIDAARKLKRFLVVFAHSELNDRSVAALESLRKEDSTMMNKMIREKFVFFAYSVLDRDTNMTPAFLTSCRSLPAVAVFKVANHHHNIVDLLATLEGTASGSTICLFLERCLSTY